MNNPKQVIVVRKDLNMRKGKMAAQVAHASMAALLNVGTYSTRYAGDHPHEKEVTQQFLLPLFDASDLNPHPDSNALRQWLLGAFTKICVYVNSEQELLSIAAQAKEAGLYHALITDSGLTEFSGVPTNTCVAVGPAYADRINTITGHLPLM